MLRKKFARDLYDSNDSKGKNAALDLFETTLGYKPLENSKELYCDGDVLLEDNLGNPIMVEAEVKNVGWYNGDFRYSTLHFAYKPKTKSDWFVSFNGRCDRAFVCKGTDLIKDDNIIFKNTRNRHNGQSTESEPFYEIKVQDCQLFRKDKNVWISV